jgi:alkylation response protein AidB-like acyl-CoA dehydrogenase
VNAIEKGNAIEISGVSAWVTGVTQCAYITLGVERHDGLQAVALVRRDAAGVSVLPHQRLGILQDSDTGEVRFNQVTVDKDALLIPFGPDVITKHAGVAVRGYPPLTTAAICAGHALGTCNHVREVKNLPASLGAICNDYITRIAQVKSCIASLAACSNPVDHSSYESLRAEANVCAIRSADLLAIACRGGALIQGGLAEQRTLESRFFLTWAMSPGCQQKTLGQL